LIALKAARVGLSVADAPRARRIASGLRVLCDTAADSSGLSYKGLTRRRVRWERAPAPRWSPDRVRSARGAGPSGW